MINGLYAVLINGVPKIKHKDAIDVSTPHVLADLETAVCSETEAVAKVTFENLDAKGDVGTGAAQVAAGNHTHTLTVTLAFYDGNTQTTGTTDWVEMASTEIPANAKKVLAWCFGSSNTSLRLGYCRLLYDGVEKLQSSGAYFAITPVMWDGDGLGFAANLTIEIKKHELANKIVWGYGASYVTIV